MKKLFIPLLLTILMVLTACDNNSGSDIIWDIYPVNVYIYVQDSDGNDLLDPEVEGNMIGENFTMIFENNDYPAVWPSSGDHDKQSDITTRAYLAQFRGLTAEHEYIEIDGEIEESPAYRLVFGEFDGAKNQDLTFRLIVPGREGEDVIHVKHKYDDKHIKPKCSTKTTLNGKEVKNTNIIIVVDKKQ